MKSIFLFISCIVLLACSDSKNSTEPTTPTAGMPTPNMPDAQPDTDTENTPWLITSSHAAVFPLELIFPRDSESADWAYNKNAYPEIEWQIPISLRGGRWPYKYEIESNGGAQGLRIGSVLDRRQDNATGKTLFEAGDEYGVLTWNSPQQGQYLIQLKVTDQDLNQISIPINLTVGIDGWLFVDAINGNDTHDGSLSMPFKTFGKLHGEDRNTDTYAQHRVIFRQGTIPLDGMASSGSHQNVVFTAGNTPLVLTAYPGETAVLEAYEGWMALLNTVSDFYMGGLGYRFRADFAPVGDLYMFTIFSQPNRVTWFNNHFHNFAGTPQNVSLGNSAVLMFDNQEKTHVSISHNTVGAGPETTMGTFVQAFEWRHGLVEHNTVRDVNVTTVDASSHSLIYLKDRPIDVTIRANNLYHNITSGRFYSGIGLGGQDGAQRVEICYNKVKTLDAKERAGAARGFTWNSDSGLIADIYWYRNSLANHFRWEGNTYTNFADGEEHHYDNALNDGAMPSHTRIESLGNIDEEALFDLSNMNLSGQARIDYLGLKGAELAD